MITTTPLDFNPKLAGNLHKRNASTLSMEEQNILVVVVLTATHKMFLFFLTHFANLHYIYNHV